MNSNTTIALYFSLALLFTLLSVAGSNHDLAGVVSQLFFIFIDLPPELDTTFS